MTSMVCKSDGCKAEVAFKTTDRRAGRLPPNSPPQPPYANSHRVLSKYCNKHTCDFFFDPEGCNFKKPHYDMVCAVHTRCPIPGCTECKGQYADPNHDLNMGIKYLRYPFCPLHKCTVPQCQMKRVQPQPGAEFLPFCPQHRCTVDGCKKKRVEQRNYCQEHKCQDPECQRVVEDSFELCSHHNECEVRVCGKNRHKIPKGKEIFAKDIPLYGIEEYGKSQYLPYCLEHGTCETVGCVGFGTPTSRHCPKHTCPERDCKASTGTNHYCDIHRCEFQGCQSSRGWKKNLKDREKFCPLHTCRKKDCLAEVPDLHLFCTKHECTKPSCTVDAVAETLCLMHLKLQFQNEGKSKAKAEMEELFKITGRNDDAGFPPDISFSKRRDETMGPKEASIAHHGGSY